VVIEAIVFPDSVELVCDELRTRLATVHVGSQVPTTRPATFVRVTRVGGVRRNLVTDEATLTVEAWAASEQAAHDLAQLCRAYVYAMPGQSDVRRVTEISGPAFLPDPESEQHRFSMTVAVAAVGAAV
jgi:hypothetical protein